MDDHISYVAFILIFWILVMALVFMVVETLFESYGIGLKCVMAFVITVGMVLIWSSTRYNASSPL